MSHYKYEAAEAARYITDKLEGRLGVPVFLDSDDLSDLRKLCEQVVQSDVLILLLTKDVLTRPWCLIELYHAITNGVPIVTVNVAGAFPFDFADARTFFADFESQLELRNPGAGDTIRQEYPGVVLKELGERVWGTVSNVIAKKYEPAADGIVIDAQLKLVEQGMRRAAMRTLSSAPQQASGGAAVTRNPASLGGVPDAAQLKWQSSLQPEPEPEPSGDPSQARQASRTDKLYRKIAEM